MEKTNETVRDEIFFLILSKWVVYFLLDMKSLAKTTTLAQ